VDRPGSLTNKENTMTTLLPPGFILRPAAWSDLEAVTQLIYAVCEADGDVTLAISPDELKREWQTPAFTLETDAWVVTTPEGGLAGYEEFVNQFEHVSLAGDGYVHPNYRGLGVGTALLTALDERAGQEVPLAPPALRVFIRNGLDAKDKPGCEIHAALGFKPIRYSWRMGITLSNVPQPVSWPKGVELHPFLLGQNNQAVHAAEQEAFADHWGHTPTSYEAWELRRLKREDFDPSLWHIAWAGDEIAGISLCRYRQGIGWVGTLGVRRPWRKQGLGMALLQHSFGEFYKRDQKIIGLGVDASNPTGATRLYERAGMRVASEFVIYEKEYRSGRDL
jgi:mycothiol synthase